MDKSLHCLDPGSPSLVSGAVAAAWGVPSRLVFHGSLGGAGARSKVHQGLKPARMSESPGKLWF